MPPDRLKIALFTYSTKLRGSVVHTLELATALHQLGHEVCIFALSKEGSQFDYDLPCQAQLIPTANAPPEIDALIQQRIQEFVDYLSKISLNYDVYHAQDCLSANALATLRDRGLIPHFFRTVHHIEDYTSPYLSECQDRSIYQADLCFCVSDRWQLELQETYKVQPHRVTNGVNLTSFSPQGTSTDSQLKQRLSLSGYPQYLTVGGVEPRKNSIALLRAFAQVRQTLPQAQLIIAGGETLFDYQDYRQSFMHVAAELGLLTGNGLVLTGVIPSQDLPALYRLADVFVFPSLKEGWGLVILEAIASGTPVITSNQTPFTEFLNQQQALLVDPTSIKEMAQAMLSICQPELAQSLVHQSQSILPLYTWKASAQKHLQHYQDFVAPVLITPV